MTKDERIVRGSKRLSWLLRHGAGEVGLTMDEAGWVPVSEVLRETGLGREELEEIVRENDKSRLQLEGERVRASQGHSRAGMPVTLEGLEASWRRFEGGPSVWHGTQVAFAEAIAREGLLPGERTHVHLAAEPESKVGKRSGAPLLLEVSVERLRERGRELFLSPNGVVLARDVPPGCVVGLRTTSRKAAAEAPRLRALFALPAPSG